MRPSLLVLSLVNWEKRPTPLTALSCQGAVESEKVSPQPPLLQTEQPQLPQPLPIRLVLQTPPQPRCPSLDMLQRSGAAGACRKAEAAFSRASRWFSPSRQFSPRPGAPQTGELQGGRQLPRDQDWKGRPGKRRRRRGRAAQPMYGRQPSGEHRASLSLLCPTRLTDHPDVPGQQLPAITRSRTRVPISRAPISSPGPRAGPDRSPGVQQSPAASSAALENGRSIPEPRASSVVLPCRRTQGRQLPAPSSPDAA